MTENDMLRTLAALFSFPADTTQRLEAITKRLDSIDDRLDRLVQHSRNDLNRDKHMSKALDKIQEEISQNKDAVESASVLLQNLSQQIRENKADEAALDKLADELDSQNKALSEAVANNTTFTPSGQ